jgi:hypothetical protein
VAEPAPRQTQLRLKARREFQQRGIGHAAKLIRHFVTQAHIVVPPDADGARLAKQARNLGPWLAALARVEGIPQRDHPFDPSLVQGGQHTAQLADRIMDVRQDSNAHRGHLHALRSRCGARCGS